MTTKKKNPLWAFFASVKLALFLLFILAATSIFGTIVQQNLTADQYRQIYGNNLANLLRILDITDMYNSWWFLSLLAFFCLNLIVCSLERIPNVIRIINKDNLNTKSDRLRKMPIRETVVTALPVEQAVESVSDFLKTKGWKNSRRQNDNGVLLFSQRGAWTRFGVYIVHSSILLILLGAIIGSSNFAQKVLHKPDFAFKGSVMIPETQSADYIWSFNGNKKIDLGFTVRCNFFTIAYYANGMPKTYLSKVSILENGQPVPLKDGKTVHFLEVNKPLTYKGITFYQSSYNPYPEFIVRLTNTKTGASKQYIIPAGKQYKWSEGGAEFGILNQESFGKAIQRVKIWFTDRQGAPSKFWLNNAQEAKINRPSAVYKMSVKQLYATGLQVTKDPGVWFVYCGCGLMLLGLFVAFFLSHRKIYAFVLEENGQTAVLFAGSAHKNKVGFERRFKGLMESFKNSIS